jgi:hypothetical protein
MNFTLRELAERIAMIEGQVSSDAVLKDLQNLSQRIKLPIEKRGNQGFLTCEAAAGAYLLLTLQKAGLYRDRLNRVVLHIFENPHFPRATGEPMKIETAVQAVKSGSGGNFTIRVFMDDEIRPSFDFAQSEEELVVNEILENRDGVKGKWIKTTITVPFADMTRRLLAKA